MKKKNELLLDSEISWWLLESPYLVQINKILQRDTFFPLIDLLFVFSDYILQKIIRENSQGDCTLLM